MIQNDLMTHLLWVYLFLSSRMLEKRVHRLPLLFGAPLRSFYAEGTLYPAEARGGGDGWTVSNLLTVLSATGFVGTLTTQTTRTADDNQ